MLSPSFICSELKKKKKKHYSICHAVSHWWRNIIDLEPFPICFSFNVKTSVLRTSDIARASLFLAAGRSPSEPPPDQSTLLYYGASSNKGSQIEAWVICWIKTYRDWIITPPLWAHFPIRRKPPHLGLQFTPPFQEEQWCSLHATCPVISFKCAVALLRWHFVSLHMSHICLLSNALINVSLIHAVQLITGANNPPPEYKVSHYVPHFYWGHQINLSNYKDQYNRTVKIRLRAKEILLLPFFLITNHIT